ncbi:MAG: DNA polymerase I [bacterium]|nr:DNA polymerase I [bacterium]
MPNEKPHLYLIDGSGFIFRAYYALPPMTRPDGTPVNAVFGFCNMLIKVLQEAKACHLAVIFDTAKKNFRHDLYVDYKANRPPPPDDLIPQFDLVREACAAFAVPSVEKEGFEADDLIATYARSAAADGTHVTIVSSDKDLMQLVGEGIDMFDPMKNRLIQEPEVREKFGVGPEQVIEVQALAGDSSDNVPGVPGIGIKTAAQLITEFGSLEKLLENTDQIPQPKRRQKLQEHAEDARISKVLVTLKEDVPLLESWRTFGRENPESETLKEFLSTQGLHRLLKRFENKAFNLSGPSVAQTPRADEKSPAAPVTIPSPSPFSATPKSQYQLIQEESALRAWVEKAQSVPVLAVDTETTSLNAMSAELVGISLSYTAGEAVYIPLAHKKQVQEGLGLEDTSQTKGEDPEDFRQIPLKTVVEILQPLLLNPAVLKVGQNIKYDLLVLSQHGLQVSPLEGTMVLSYVVDGAQQGHGLDDLALRHLDHTMIPYSTVTGGTGKKAITFDYVPLGAARDYACEDADMTLQLYEILKPRLVASGMMRVYETMDRPLISVLKTMEQAGVQVDPLLLKGMSREFESRLGGLEKEIHTLAGEEFNVASPKQVGEILFGVLGFEGGKKSKKTGAYTTGAEVLERLTSEGHEVPARILEWRKLAKLKSTYTDTLPKQINAKTGRVHTSYSLASTLTGRLSSSDPNLQNIPIRGREGKRIREAFVAPKGHCLLSFDYSQIEIRLLAHVADVEPLKEALKHGDDIHALTASQAFGVPLSEVTSELRSRAKAINFGIIYGISAFGLARQLNIRRSEAATYIKNYLERYDGIARYMDDKKQEAKEQGYITTLLGRRCYIAGIGDKNPMRRQFAERQAINAPLQGGASDIIKKAMIAIDRALRESSLKARMLLQVHDELIFEVPESEVDALKALVLPLMEGVIPLNVPLKVDVGVGQNWAQAH